MADQRFSRTTPGFSFLQFSLLLAVLLLTAGLQTARAQGPETYEWRSVAIGGGGFVSAIIPSKTEAGLVYARTDVGGAYRWDKAKGEWVPLLDWTSAGEVGLQGVESIALDPQAPGKVYILAGTSYFNSGRTVLLRSNDYGRTFEQTDVSSLFKAHGNGMGRQTGEKLVVDPNNSNYLFCGTRANGLFRSTDAGANWSRLSGLHVSTTPNGNGISFVLPDPVSRADGATQTLYAGVSATGTNLYKSTDGGATFSPIAGAPTNLMPQRAVLASDGHLFITYANGGGPHGHGSLPEPMDSGKIWKYHPQTGIWTDVTPPLTRAYGGISVDPANPLRLLASTINTYMLQDNNAYGDRLFLSNDGGASWTDLVARGFDLDPNGVTWINGHSIHWAGSIEFDPFDTKKAWVTSGNGIFKTDNVDAPTNVWKFTVKGLEETVPLDLVAIPNGPVVSVIGDYDGFRHTNVSQDAPIHNPRMGTSTGIAFAGLDPNILLRVGSKMYFSTDMGLTWTQCTMNGAMGKVAVSANGAIFLHTPENSSTTYRSTNRGSSWTPVSGLTISDARTVADPVNPNKFYAYDRSTGRVWVSTNAGVSFSVGASTSPNGSRVIRVTPGVEGHVWVPLQGGGLVRSTNSGQSFTSVSGVISCDAVGLGKAAPGKTYPTLYIWGNVNQEIGLYRSTDEGANWLRINDDAHEYGGPGNGQFVVGDMNAFSRVYMSTVGRGIIYGQAQGTVVTGIKTPVRLNFRYGPNPFTGAFRVVAPYSFTYELSNLLGARVASGFATGKALVGAGLPPGVYLLSVQGRNGKQTVRVVKE